MRELSSSISFSLVASRWPSRLPLVALAGSGRYAMIAAAFDEVSFDDAAREPLVPDPGKAGVVPFTSGLLGVLAYDDLAAHALGRGVTAPRSRIFRVRRALVRDDVLKKWLLTGDDIGPATQHALHDDELEALMAYPPSVGLPDLSGIALVPRLGDETYLQQAAAAIEMIRDGRFYQINLLRYFTLTHAPDRAWLLARMARLGEAFACLLDVPGLTLASFSPERFVRMAPGAEAGELVVEAEPVKGTAARVDDPAKDRAVGQALLASPKDRAELHMIVDLLRNDLNRIARRGTVVVPEATRLTTHASVHHLSAIVEARVDAAGMTFGEFLAALAPAGSITGAPKREVMTAIRETEGRERGLFMGHAFYLDRSGRLDSSVLIRTLARTGDGAGEWEYAAGSGITISSDPEAERREIEAKARVVTQDA